MVQRFGTPFRANRNSLPEEPSNTTAMRSPLPDSSALEAGILEDERPSRLSRVQDNVRNLLRASVFGSVKSSPTTPTHPPQRRCDVHPSPIAGPEVLPSPLSSQGSAGSSTTHLSERVADFPEPPRSYQDRVQEMARQSAMFNNRAVAALRHPDLSDPSLESLELQKAQIRRRKAKKRSYRSRKMAQTAGSRGILCVLASLLLAALVATCTSMVARALSILLLTQDRYLNRNHRTGFVNGIPRPVHPWDLPGNHRLRPFADSVVLHWKTIPEQTAIGGSLSIGPSAQTPRAPSPLPAAPAATSYAELRG